MSDDSPRIVARYCWTNQQADLPDLRYRSPNSQTVASPSSCELLSPSRHQRSATSLLRPRHLDPVPRHADERTPRPDVDPVLLKIWDCCVAVACELLEKRDVGSEGELQGLPLQFVLLTVRFMKLELSWDDTLRVVRRHVEPAVSLPPHPPAMSLCIVPFVRCLQQLIELHLSVGEAKEARRLGNTPFFQPLAEFTRSLWIGSKELSRLKFFLQLSFEGPIHVASLMTASVLDVVSAYKDRLEWLHNSLLQLSICDIDGVTTALCQLSNLSGATATLPTSSTDARALVVRYFPTFFCDEAQQGCPNVRTYNGFCEWIAMLSSAASLSGKCGPNELFHTAHVRTAVLDVLGEALGSLLLPFSVVSEVLRQGIALTLKARESDRLRLKKSIEQSLLRLYIHYCGAQDINGFGLLTGLQMKRLLADSRVLDRIPEIERLSIETIISCRPESTAASPCRSHGHQSHAATDSQDSLNVISFPIFLSLIEKFEQVSTPIPGAAQPLSQLLLSSPAGLEAARAVPSSVVEVTDEVVATALQLSAPAQVKSWCNHTPRGALQKSKWVTVHDALQWLFERLLVAETMHYRQARKGPITNCSANSSSGASCVSVEFLIRILTRGNIIPSMMSRADASRVIRRLKIMRGGDLPAVKMEDFEFIAVCAGSSPRTKLSLQEGMDLIIRSLEKCLTVHQ